MIHMKVGRSAGRGRIGKRADVVTAVDSVNTVDAAGRFHAERLAGLSQGNESLLGVPRYAAFRASRIESSV